MIIDTLSVSEDKYVLISENRISFLSGINAQDLDSVIEQERELIESNHYQVNNNENEIDEQPHISFIPTLDCNLRCIYCYARGGEDKVYMKPELGRKAIDSLLESIENPQNKILSIYFVGGGEPFMNFPFMQDVCEYAKGKFADVEIILVTNGTFGQKQRQWLIDNRASVRISYDGLAQDEHRLHHAGNSIKHIVENNIRELAKTDIYLTIQLTITNQSVTRMLESVKHIASLGAKYIKIEPVHVSVISRGEKDLIPDLDLFIENFINTIKYVADQGIDVKIDNSYISRPTSGYYCGAGEGSNLVVTPSGLVTSCLEISRPNEVYSDVMIYGECSENGIEIDSSKREFLNRLHWSNYQNCPNCNLKLICGGSCPMQGAWDNQDLFHPSDYNCYAHKSILPQLFKMIFENNKVLDVVFDNYTASSSC
jgi:uncharacterized protein